MGRARAVLVAVVVAGVVALTGVGAGATRPEPGPPTAGSFSADGGERQVPPVASSTRARADGGKTRPVPGAAQPAGVQAATGGQPAATSGTGWDQRWLDVPQLAWAGVQQLADTRAAALLAGDRRGLLATVDASAPVVGRQAMLAANLARLRPRQWDYTVAALTPGPSGAAGAGGTAGQTLHARVVLRYQLRAWAGGMVTRWQTWTVRAGAGRWLLVDDGAGRPGPYRDVDLWDIAPVTVTDGARSLVITAGGLTWAPDVLAAQADTAVRRVVAVWPGPWSRHVVLVAPATPAQLTRLVPVGGGQPPTRDWSAVAALTSGPSARADRESDADQILLNPHTWPRLLPIGQQVVLTHEATHVATRAVMTRPLPGWLTEGFADYVAFQGAGLPPARIAPDALAAAAATGPPPRLPTDAQLNGQGGPPDLAYQRSWLAVRAVAERWGQHRVIDWFRAAARQPLQVALDPTAAVDRASRRVLGVDLARLVQLWRGELRQLAADAAASGGMGR